MSSSKRQTDSADDASTPAKRTKTTQEGAESGGAVDRSQAAAASSPVVTHGTDSPSAARASTGGNHAAAENGRGRGGKRGGGRGGDRELHKGRGGKRGGGGDSRQWGGRTDNAKGGMRQWGPKDTTENTDSKQDRLPKKKVAVMIGYNGLAYRGSQINPGTATVEGEFFQALIKAGAISEDNSDDHQKVGLSRAARTDAGVHAAYNVLSLKMILSPPGMPADSTLEDYINTFLPPTVRVWSIIRVQGAFDPRKICDQRRYEYTLPTHVLLGPKPGTPMYTWLEKARNSAKPSAAVSSAVHTVTRGAPLQEPAPAATAASPETEGASGTDATAGAAIAESDRFWANQPADSRFEADIEGKKAWRITPGRLKSAREFVKAYEGSHNFYNFTVGKDFRDRSCQRTMRELKISDPFVVNDVEYMSVGFVGQSFMLHQIRKMIGLMILAVRTSTPSSLIAETFGPGRVHIPKAPALGLILLGPEYGEYNKKIEEANRKLEDLRKADRLDEQGMREQWRDPLLVKEGEMEQKIDAFKQNVLFKKMWEMEANDATFSKWINYLDMFLGSDFEYLNPKGVIPATALFHKGQNSERLRIATAPAVGGAVTTAEDTPSIAPPLSDDEGPARGEDDG